MNVLYLCDRKPCGDKCTYPDCRHTTDISHAVNFVKIRYSPRNLNEIVEVYTEKEENYDGK